MKKFKNNLQSHYTWYLSQSMSSMYQTWYPTQLIICTRCDSDLTKIYSVPGVVPEPNHIMYNVWYPSQSKVILCQRWYSSQPIICTRHGTWANQEISCATHGSRTNHQSQISYNHTYSEKTALVSHKQLKQVHYMKLTMRYHSHSPFVPYSCIYIAFHIIIVNMNTYILINTRCWTLICVYLRSRNLPP